MARFAILLFILPLLSGVNCQTSGTSTSLPEIESKLDQQQNVQNQILTTQTSLLKALMEQQNVQNQVLTNVVGLLQKHDEQMDNMNHVLSGMSNLMKKQNQQLESISDLLSQQQQSQTQIISDMASSLHNITEK